MWPEEGAPSRIFSRRVGCISADGGDVSGSIGGEFPTVPLDRGW